MNTTSPNKRPTKKITKYSMGQPSKRLPKSQKKIQKIRKHTYIRFPNKDEKLYYYHIGNDRCNLIELLRKRKINNNIIHAFSKIPRECFVEKKHHFRVYKDIPLPINYKQVTTQPSLICNMLQLLDLRPIDNVLEIGTGTGFNTSIISTMVKNITTMENLKPLIKDAKKIMDILKLRKILKNNITLIRGDGALGYKKNGPYDRIIFAAGNLAGIPDGITEQLKEGGVLVIPIIYYKKGKKIEHVYKYVKKKGKMTRSRHLGVNFVPLTYFDGPQEDFTNKGPKDYSGIVKKRNLNTLLLHSNLALKRCRLYEVIRRRIRKDTLNAFMTIPRELFMPFLYIEKTYNDKPHPIGYDQTISQPSLVCKMIEFLNLKKTDRVFEVGTGYGYHASLVSKLSKEVFTMDVILELVEGSREVYNFLIKNKILKNNITFLHGDGNNGYLEKAPYDKILVTCGANKKIPDELLNQLSPNGGICVIPIKNKKTPNKEVLYRYTKNGSNIKEEELMGVRFVPFVKKPSLKTKILI